MEKALLKKRTLGLRLQVCYGLSIQHPSKAKMKLPNLGPHCCILRPKMMRTLWTLRGRLQYILAKRIFQKKKKNDDEMK